ncbi:MAG: HlyD family efflux transporter periplasmic adaptor subunit [Desulfovibrionaceae bacterium]|nr:HlyD family efflux transporter periplasmic adaptor subunit [Desulfovibrionaceae bacterium]
MKLLKPNSDATTGRGASHRLDALIGSLFTAGSHEELFQAICGLGCETAGAVGVAVLARHQGNVRVITASPPASPEAGEMPSWLLDLAKSYGQMLAENCQTVALSPGPGGAHGVFVPLLTNEHGSLVLAAYVLGGRQIRLQSVSDILQLVRASLFLVERASQNGAEAKNDLARDAAEAGLPDVVDIVSEVQTCTRFFEAASTLCVEASAKFECRRVALGIVREGHVKAVALDQMESFSRGTRSVRQMEEVMQEALDQDRMILYSSLEGESAEPGVITRAARELAATSNTRRILSIPLRTQEDISFIMLFMLEGESFTDHKLSALSLVCRLAAPRLRDLQLAEELPLKKAWRYFVLRSADIFGPRRTVLKLAASLIGIGLTLSLLVSGDIVVSAPLTIEGVHSYTHTAPMDSYLYEVLARPGDQVKAGDILGRLDATEIGLEMAALEAQQNIHESQADQYLQEGKDAEAAIARLEADRTAANLAWARQRLAMTELKSSVDGFLVSEDMFPRLGQPVRRGQELFEVTDTASLRVIVHVDESDISDINRTMAKGKVRGKFTLTAYPDVRIPFTVERIHPFAAVAGASNGFEVRGHIDIDAVPGSLVLRPGMEGHARIIAGETPLLALWTRKLVNKVRLIMWRWL